MTVIFAVVMAGVSLILAIAITLSLAKLIKITKKLETAVNLLANEKSNLVKEFTSIIDKTNADLERYSIVIKSAETVQENIESTSNAVKNIVEEPSIKIRSMKSGFTAGLRTFKAKRK